MLSWSWWKDILSRVVLAEFASTCWCAMGGSKSPESDMLLRLDVKAVHYSTLDALAAKRQPTLPGTQGLINSLAYFGASETSKRRRILYQGCRRLVEHLSCISSRGIFLWQKEAETQCSPIGLQLRVWIIPDLEPFVYAIKYIEYVMAMSCPNHPLTPPLIF